MFLVLQYIIYPNNLYKLHLRGVIGEKSVAKLRKMAASTLKMSVFILALLLVFRLVAALSIGSGIDIHIIINDSAIDNSTAADSSLDQTQEDLDSSTESQDTSSQEDDLDDSDSGSDSSDSSSEVYLNPTPVIINNAPSKDTPSDSISYTGSSTIKTQKKSKEIAGATVSPSQSISKAGAIIVTISTFILAVIFIGACLLYKNQENSRKKKSTRGVL